MGVDRATGARISAAPLPPAAKIEALVTEHQAAIQNALTDPMSAPGSPGERLYQSPGASGPAVGGAAQRGHRAGRRAASPELRDAGGAGRGQPPGRGRPSRV